VLRAKRASQMRKRACAEAPVELGTDDHSVARLSRNSSPQAAV
jgi:hypothetical protein